MCEHGIVADTCALGVHVRGVAEMVSLKLLKDIAEHHMERYEIPWDEEELHHLILAANEYLPVIAEYEQAYVDTQEALYTLEEELIMMYKIRVLHERYLAIHTATQ